MTVPVGALVFVVLMSAIRGGLAAVGYVAPSQLSKSLGAEPAANPQMPYVVRVWAARDIVLAITTVGVALDENRTVLRLLLSVCLAVDLCDVVTAQLAYRQRLFGRKDAISLTCTALAAIVPEVIALTLLR